MKAKNKNQKRLKSSNDRRFWKIRTNEVIIEPYWEARIVTGKQIGRAHV